MRVAMLKSKLHKATVTQVAIGYEGSLSIDADLMERVKILPYEKVLVGNLENGERFETYAIPAPRGSGTICLNGPAAHKGSVGDRVVVMTFALLSDEECAGYRPLVMVLDEHNRPVGGLREA